MARRDDHGPNLLHALAAHYGLPDRSAASRPGSFRAVVAAFLSDGDDPGRRESLAMALERAGLDEARVWLDREAGDLLSALKAEGISRTPKVIPPLKRLANWWTAQDFGADVIPNDLATEALREEWLRLKGLGPSTVDEMLRLGVGRAVYPVDRASFRIAARHGWVEPWADYDEARSVLERLGGEDAAGMGRLASWLVRVGRDFCKIGSPRCERCPLRPWLPESGPIGSEE